MRLKHGANRPRRYITTMSKKTTNQEYQHNHYVPEWYQRRFMLQGQHRYWYLDLKPDEVVNGKVRYVRRDLLNWGPALCFAEHDLYTTEWGGIQNTDIEQFFFGGLDNKGKKAVEYFGSFGHPSADGDLFQKFVQYMSVQKLRTPKGLGFLKPLMRGDKNRTLLALQHLQNIHCAIWTESVWQIADIEDSATKLIISDHPVTVYNRECFPMSDHCSGFNDPDIRLAATHTYFPLSLDRVLILTNLSWARNPYQSELTMRPNPELVRNAIFNFLDIQTDRKLSEQEVLEINYITKRRAHRYIAAAEKEWLYPERRLKNPHWRKLGDGYLFMPDPRHVHMGGEILIGYSNGRSDAFNEYGHRPWDRDYKNEERERRERESLYRFQAEWAATIGRKYRGISYQFTHGRGKPRTEDIDEIHTDHLKTDQQFRKRAGERQRRRKLKR